LNSKLAKSDFNETYSEEATLAYLDSLNMIYVALTRAEEVIWGLVPFKEIKKDTSKNNLEIHLQQILSGSLDHEGELSLSEHFDPETKTFDFGAWPKMGTKVKEEKHTPQLRWAYQNWSELLKVKQYAIDFSAEGIAQRKKQNLGLLVHEILEKSGTLTECKSNLQAFFFEGRISEEERLQVESQLQGLFADPIFASWFDTEGVLLAEQGILLPGGKQKRPDRIILKDSEAIIVDFKTGEAYEKYEKQVREYMDLVGKLASKPVKGFICYLETGKIVEVV
jgi:ATP-dependent exoDNAse (exonuclease V) beta subunit